MVSTIERFHCIQDSQLGPNGVHYREVLLYLSSECTYVCKYVQFYVLLFSPSLSALSVMRPRRLTRTSQSGSFCSQTTPSSSSTTWMMPTSLPPRESLRHRPWGQTRPTTLPSHRTSPQPTRWAWTYSTHTYIRTYSVRTYIGVYSMYVLM